MAVRNKFLSDRRLQLAIDVMQCLWYDLYEFHTAVDMMCSEFDVVYDDDGNAKRCWGDFNFLNSGSEQTIIEPFVLNICKRFFETSTQFNCIPQDSLHTMDSTCRPDIV